MEHVTAGFDRFPAFVESPLIQEIQGKFFSASIKN